MSQISFSKSSNPFADGFSLRIRKFPRAKGNIFIREFSLLNSSFQVTHSENRAQMEWHPDQIKIKTVYPFSDLTEPLLESLTSLNIEFENTIFPGKIPLRGLVVFCVFF